MTAHDDATSSTDTAAGPSGSRVAPGREHAPVPGERFGDGSVPVHCGSPMPVRRLDPVDPWCPANRAVLEAAVAGERVHTCACGFLRHVPAAPQGGSELCAPQDRAHFGELFLRRVQTAAGTAESAQWEYDRILTDAPTGPGIEDQWVVDADLETAQWALDAAELDLDAAVALAAVHGVPAQLLARAAGRPEAGPVTLEPSPGGLLAHRGADGPTAEPAAHGPGALAAAG